MERFFTIVRPRFRKHWRTIACQVHAVNDRDNPKRGFLFDCGKANVDALVDLVTKLKIENLISKDISVVIVKDDIFILNVEKFHEQSHIVIDISGNLEQPKIMKVEDATSIEEMFRDIKNQIKSSKENSLIHLEIRADYCVPTIFGYLINYPIVYYHENDANCLSLVDLNVHQILIGNETLISFSVPSAISNENLHVQQAIENWLHNFQSKDEFLIKTFTANYPTVIL